jgi:hypothetical protein
MARLIDDELHDRLLMYFRTNPMPWNEANGFVVRLDELPHVNVTDLQPPADVPPEQPEQPATDVAEQARQLLNKGADNGAT